MLPFLNTTFELRSEVLAKDSFNSRFFVKRQERIRDEPVGKT